MGEQAKGGRSALLRYQLPPILWMALIFLSSSIPGYDYPSLSWAGWPKLVHVVFYSTLCFLTWRALQHHAKMDWAERHSALTAFAVAIVYGMIDETHQYFTAGRHPRFTDVLIDAAGAGLFLLALHFYRSLKGIDDTAY